MDLYKALWAFIMMFVIYGVYHLIVGIIAWMLDPIVMPMIKKYRYKKEMEKYKIKD